MRKKFSLKKRAKSFTYAFAGVKLLLKEEHNALIHLFATVLAISLGVFLKISSIEWMFVLVSIGLVFSAELFNTAIEHLCNYISPMNNAVIKKVKDLAAAGVLMVAIAAFLVGAIIFIPKIVELLS
ncbi:MAG: diacylglycerol kinase family protein [Breznakibacter sp.]|nr:diacylglycerol kinase family protein [Breznakibacter sp.]